MKQTLKQQASQLPVSPGVYLFYNNKKEILYIGRATALRRRVANYFRKDIDPRIGEMVSQAVVIKHITTDSVLDAIILEANLIKKHWPKYNVKDKDHRSFTYIVIAKMGDYPRPLIVRERELNKFPLLKHHIFGPYQSQLLMRQALKIIRRFAPYSTCKPLSGKPCFDYQLGLCPGACIGAITPRQYRQSINRLVLFLRGDKQKLMDKLAKSDPTKAQSLRHIYDATLVGDDAKGMTATPSRIEAYDISHLAGRETVGAMTVLTGGEPDNSQYRLFNIRSVGNNDLHALGEMIERRFAHAEWPRPDVILIDGGKPQIDYLTPIFAKLRMNAPYVGLSKFGGDALVFPPGVKPSIKELVKSIKPLLQLARDEAHRFGRNASRKQRQKKVTGQR